MLKVYADETGSHDGADMLALAGLIESREHWQKFNTKWAAVLKNYDAKFFHYRKFRKGANTRPGDPYYGWSDEKRRNFIFRLAMLVGESAVPTGGVYPIEHNKKLGLKHNPIDSTINAFYKSTLAMLDLHWPDYGGKVLFIYDKGSKRELAGALVETHNKLKEIDSRIGDIVFEDDKNICHCGLQGADLSAIHSRNKARGYIEAGGGIFDIGIIDFIVGKNVDRVFRNVPEKMIKKIIADMKNDESLQRNNGFTGAYIPLKHFDFKKYGYQN